jgi:hypothetical protein
MITLFGAWRRLPIRLANATIKVPLIIDRVIAREAHRFRNAVVKSFREQQSGGQKWTPISRFTLVMRQAGLHGRKTGGSKALVRSGALRASTKVDRQGYAKYRVSQHRRGRRGVDLAKLHESGPVIIPITDKMRRYFNYMFWKGLIPFTLPRRARHLIIPRRSSMVDTYKVFKRGSKARVLADFAAEMGRL